jgi:large subunit ribosomal protein L1
LDHKGGNMAEAKKTTTKKKAAVKKAEVKPKKEVVDNGNSQEDSNVALEADDQGSQEAEVKTAKAGKRSAKATREAEEKEAKEERKAKATAGETEDKKPKATQKPARSRLERQGKKFREAAKHIDTAKEYSLSEAIELAMKTNPVKFDATAELHIRLGVDPRQADQNVRDTVVLPAGTGKTIRIAVLAEGDVAEAATKAGADIVGLDDLLADIEKEKLNFDVLVATPPLMARLGKYAKVLGPKGLMPNPKSGTVTMDAAKAVKEAKAGRIEYRVDSAGIVHIPFGKVSFGADKLGQNAQAVVASVRNAKPNSLKGTYINSVYVTTSMGPSIKVAPSEV